MALYKASGSPQRSTLALMWGTLYLPSLGLGLVTGMMIAILSPTSPLKGWGIFLFALLGSAAALGVMHGDNVAADIASLFAPVGNVLFWAGTLVWPAVIRLRSTRSHVATTH